MREWKQLISINLVLVMLLGNLLPLAAAFEPSEDGGTEPTEISEEVEPTEFSGEDLLEQDSEEPENTEEPQDTGDTAATENTEESESAEAPGDSEGSEEPENAEEPENSESAEGPMLAAATVNYQEAVDVITAAGLLPDDFAADQQLTRAMAAQLISRLVLSPATADALRAETAPFTDVAADDPYAGYIAYCAAEGLISGYGDGTFRSENPITGFAVFKLLLCALGYDAETEGYTGQTWSVNVAKQALELGLDAGLQNDFAGSAAVTQEEACLYALNTLKARPVEYEAGYSVKIDDVVITVPERVKANPDYTSYADKMTQEGAAALEWTYEEGTNGLAAITYTVDGELIGIYETEMPDEDAAEEVLFEEVLLEAAQAGLLKYFQPAEWDTDYEMARLDIVKLCAAFLEAKGELDVSNYSPDDISFTDKYTMLDTEQELVAAVTTLGIMGGYEDGSFKPAEVPTRAAVTKILCNLLLGQSAASALTADAAPFADVPQDNIFAGYIAYCKDEDIVYGDESDNFYPADAATERTVLEWFLRAQEVDVSAIPSGVFQDFIWMLEENGCLTIMGSGMMPDCSEAPWLAYSSSIQTVVMEEGITCVGQGAFAGCALTAVELPESIESIEPMAFAGSALPEITLGRGVTKIAIDAFMGCPSGFLIRGFAGSAAARYAAAQEIAFEAVAVEPEDWPIAWDYPEAVDVLFATGILMDSFDPNRSLTNAEAAQILCRLALSPEAADALTVAEDPFEDMTADNLYAAYAAYCVEEGLLSGSIGWSFRPDNNITKYGFTKALLTILGYEDLAYDEVSRLALNLGLTNGLKGSYSASGYITHEVACLYALNVLKAQPVISTYDDETDETTYAADPNYASYAQKLFGSGGKALTWTSTVNTYGSTETTYVYQGTTIGTYAPEILDTGNPDEAEFTALLTAACQNGLLKYFQPAEWEALRSMTRMDLVKLCAGFLESEGRLHLENYAPEDMTASDSDELSDLEQQLVAAVMGADILDDYSSSYFRPNYTMYRGEATQVICNLLLGATAAGALTADAAPFSDVAKNNIYAGVISYCVSEGIVYGNANGRFNPSNSFTQKAALEWFLRAKGVYVPAVIAGKFSSVSWTIDKDGCLTLSGNGAMPDCTNAPWRFYNCSFDQTVIQDGITSVGQGAFAGCTLTSVELPDSVTAIGARAFAGAIIPEITLSYEVTSIGEDAFADCPDGFFIRGFVGSTAETYAEDNQITFVPYDEESVVSVSLHGGSLLSQFFRFLKRLVGDVLSLGEFTKEAEWEYIVYASNANLDTWNAEIVSWNTAEDGTGTSYATSANLTLDGDTELYAQWQIPEFTVDGQSYTISEPAGGTGWTYDPAAEYQLQLENYTGGGLEFPREVSLRVKGTNNVTGDIRVYGNMTVQGEKESALTVTGNIRAGAKLDLRTGNSSSWTVNGGIHSWEKLDLRVNYDASLTVNGNIHSEAAMRIDGGYSDATLTVNGSLIAGRSAYLSTYFDTVVTVNQTSGGCAVDVSNDFDCYGVGQIRISSTGPCAVKADRSYFSGVHDLEISAAEKALEGKFSHNASRQHLYLEPNGTPVKGSYRGGSYLRLEAAKWTLTLYANGGTWKDQTGEALVIETTMGSSVWLDSYSDDVSRIGSILNGWENRVTETVLPLDHSVYATGSNLELYASWTNAGMLRIGGGEYDPDTAHDYSNGKTSGWRYDPSNSTKNLYLYDYTGGEIFLPYNTHVYLSGSNTVTSTSSATAAISSTKDLYFQKNYNNDGFGPYALTVQGGSGMPAMEANYVYLQRGTTITLTGGSGAPAVHAMEQLSIDTGHATLTGGSDAPAFYTSGGNLYAYSSDVRFFAGETAETAVEMSGWDYDGEHCIITKPIYHTLRLDANGGKANGRGVLELRMEAGDSFRLDDLDMYRGNDIFSHWENAEGDEYSYSINIWEDTELTAQWITLPYEDYVVLDCQGTGTIDGERTSYLELPAAGKVTLPTPQINASYQDRYVFRYWQGERSDGSWVTVPAGVPFDVGLFESGMTLWASYTQTPRYQIYLDFNGVASSNGQPLISRSSSSNPVSINRWEGSCNAEGLVIDSWNTKPDGSGTSYQPGDSVTVEAGVYNTMLYAQWKPILTYTTVSANEILPSWNNTIKAYVRNKNGSSVTSLIAWRNADGTEFYVPGDRCGLPAGTTVYAFCGDVNTNANVWLYGNGATEPVTAMPSGMWNESVDDSQTAFRYYTVLNTTGYVRPGYKLTGWNTRADGRGEFYPIDHKFYYGTETQGSDGYWNMEFDEAALALIPDKLYAQWEKEPSAEIPVPEDMRQEENAVIYVAIYDQNGAFVSIQTVSPEEEYYGLYNTESGMTYRFFCLADDGTEIPLTTAEYGTL